MVQDNNAIYWGYDRLLEKQKLLLKKEVADGVVSKENGKLITRFQDHLATTGTKYARIAKITWGLRKIAALMKKPLNKATKVDIERVAAAIQNDPEYKETTKSDYKRVLKHFFGWWEDEDSRLESEDMKVRKEAEKLYKYLRKHVKTTCPLPEVDPGSIITNEEVDRVLVQGCKTSQEKAFIKFLHEGGCRIGEVLGMKIKDVQPGKSVWSVRVSGKTGERPFPVRESIPYLSMWLNEHPTPENPEAFLWVSLHNRWRGERLRYWGARRLIERCFQQAGLTGKKMNPHHWRHSRATYDAAEFSDSVRCQMRGWQQGSQMVKRYTHMNGTQVVDVFKKVKGLQEEVEVKQSPKEQVCAVCKELNTPTAKYCQRCGKALRIETAVQEQEYLTLAFKVLGEIMSDPERRERFEAWQQANKTF